MYKNYILRTETELYSFSNINGRGIVCRVYDGGRWSAEIMIIKGARDAYTVTLGADGVIYLFCQDVQGDVVMSLLREGEWSSRVVLKNPSDNRQPVLIYPIFGEDGISLVYNVPAGEDRGGYIVSQKLERDGRWLPASRIDKFYEMNGALFTIQQLAEEHYILYYQAKSPENNLVYRELTPEKQSSVKLIHSTGYNIADSSYLTADDGIHTLYIIRSMFSSQLIYRQKLTEQFAAPVVLCEGQNIQNCLLYFLKDNLYAAFVSNSQLYYCVSEDRGRTFSRPARYLSKICMDPVKAVYLDTQMTENTLYCRQVYVDRINPWHVQIFPEMYDDFLPRASVVRAAYIGSASDTEDGEDIRELIERQRNQNILLERQNAEKDKQLLSLTAMLKTRNDDLMKHETERKAMQNRYEEEINFLKGELEKAKQVLDRYGGDARRHREAEAAEPEEQPDGDPQYHGGFLTADEIAVLTGKEAEDTEAEPERESEAESEAEPELSSEAESEEDCGEEDGSDEN